MYSPETDPKYQHGEPSGPDEFSGDVIVSDDTRRANRIPPGQQRTRKWPVLHASDVPRVDVANWRLDVGGLVERPLTLTWGEFRALPRVRVFSDFHCVTHWSRLSNVWEGVSIHELLRHAGVKSEAKFVVALGYDWGWTTNLPLRDLLSHDVLVADIHDGEPLDPDHGGPARLIVPKLYAWKSAKWLKAIHLVAKDQPGYWEQGGYHNHGDPWAEERFG